MNSTKKGKYLQIPIVSHNSEKPSFSFEEITSGKFIPTKYTFSTTNYSSESKQKKSCTKYINKKFKEIPIIPHDSEKPSIAIEEISFGKQNSIIQTSYTNYKSDKNSKKCSKKEKSKTSVPIQDSELPSICFEEAKSGKMFSNIQTSLTNYKVNEDKLKAGKKNIKKEKCNKTEIIIHESEKPSLVFEETNAGNKYKSIQTSVTEYKEEKTEKCDKKETKEKKNEKLRGKKREKHDKTPEKKSKIIIHESEKPSFVFEQNNSGKLFSCVKTSETDFEKIKKLKKIYDFKEIPIVSHNSEQPTLVFEEANTGITYDFHHMI